MQDETLTIVDGLLFAENRTFLIKGESIMYTFDHSGKVWVKPVIADALIKERPSTYKLYPENGKRFLNLDSRIMELNGQITVNGSAVTIEVIENDDKKEFIRYERS